MDKTGLISWLSNKYSVPMEYQSSSVKISTNDGKLFIHNLSSSEVIAEHIIRLEKGQIIKNTNHFRDLNKYIEDLETEIKQLTGNIIGESLCALLKKTSPKIYKDQLAASKKIINSYKKDYGDIESELIERILTSARLTATQLRDRLWLKQHTKRLEDSKAENITTGEASKMLGVYANLNVQPIGQGESHVIH